MTADRAAEVARLLLEHGAATARVARDPHSQYDRDEQREAHAAILAIVRELEAKLDALRELGHDEDCMTAECDVCSVLDCPHHDPLHHHHDGCPACAQETP